MKALKVNKLPPNNAWRSAEFVLPGLIAHQSALRDGETMAVPKIEDIPKNWEMLNPDSFVAYRFE